MFRMKHTFPILLLTTLLISPLAQAQVPYIKTIAGTGTGGFSGDGFTSTAAELNAPQGVAVDPTGNVYIMDYLNFRIRKVNTTGSIFTIAGNGGIGHTGDGSVATSAEVRPTAIALDATNNLYISDASHGVIRKVNSLGIISTVAGIGIQGYTGNGGPATAAKLTSPYGMVFDAAGNLYVAEGINNVIRKINTSGTITGFAGNDTAGYSGDGGPATLAKLDSPYAVAADSKGNVFISDMVNNVIRKVDASGIITTYAGTGTAGYSGDNGPATMATFNRPAGIMCDAADNLYIADAYNDVIRKVDTYGVVTTVVGNGTPGFGGDLGPVNGCNLHTPFGVAVDVNGNLYIADANNQRIRATYSPTAVGRVHNDKNISVYPNPATNSFSVSGLAKSDKVSIYDIAGRVVSTTPVTSVSQVFSTSLLSSGVYMVYVNDAAGNRKAVAKLVKE